MSVWKLVKLNFGRSTAHFGETGIGLEKTSERVRSDTLFSAWVSAYAKLWGSDIATSLLQQFSTSERPDLIPPFRISSTFIYRKDGNEDIYYLPRPLISNPPKSINQSSEEIDPTSAKNYKKLKYLPLKEWQRWYQQEDFTDQHYKRWVEEYESAFKIGLPVPKIAVDRVTRATNLYHTGFVQFCWKQNDSRIDSLSGLYFLLEFPKENRQLENTLHAALLLLGEEGLGGERSSGSGRFDVEWLDLPEDWQNVLDFSQPTHYSLISVFWELPLTDGLITDYTSYEILERGGWIAASPSGRQLRRQSIQMFVEGSIFPIEPKGKLANVTPREFIKAEGEYRPHPIYRSGISMSLPIRIKSE